MTRRHRRPPPVARTEQCDEHLLAKLEADGFSRFEFAPDGQLVEIPVQLDLPADLPAAAPRPRPARAPRPRRGR